MGNKIVVLSAVRQVVEMFDLQLVYSKCKKLNTFTRGFNAEKILLICLKVEINVIYYGSITQ
jgi:hypothetical protein